MTENESTYARMGIATLLPGIDFILNSVEHRLDELLALLAETEVSPEAPMVKPPEAKTPGSGQAAYWANMTPQQRKREVMRRMRKRRRTIAKRPKKTLAMLKRGAA